MTVHSDSRTALQRTSRRQQTLWLALFFPQLPLDRLRRAGRTPHDPGARPFVLFAREGNAFRLSAVCPLAAAAGLQRGQPLADARAILPGLVAAPADPDADAACLAALADACDRFSPVAVLDPPDGLLLEIAGSLHLFGGAEGLLLQAVARLGRAGFGVRAAIAPTPSAARALARFDRGDDRGDHRGRIVSGADLVAALADLPVEALRLGDAQIALLRRLGLHRLGALLDAPRQPLAARIGTDAVREIDQLLGGAGEALSPRRPPPPVFAAGRFLEPITAIDAILVAADRLARDLCRRLDARGAGVRRLRLLLLGVDDSVREAVLGLSRPERDPAALLRLLRERLSRDAASFEAEFGFEAARLEALEIAPLVLQPASLAPAADPAWRRDPGAEARLVDALAARLGPASVRRPAIAAARLPERAAHFLPLPEAARASCSCPSDPPPEDGVMRRPLVLLSPPQPVEAVAGVPDGPPMRFRWRRLLREVVRAEGPERILPDWLSAAAGERVSRLRDYYRIEDADGRRYWLYREGLFGDDDPPRWFIHGVFA